MNPSSLPAFLQPRSVREAQQASAYARPSIGTDSDSDDDQRPVEQLDFAATDAASPTSTQKNTSPGYRPVTDTAAAKAVHVRSSPTYAPAAASKPLKVSASTGTEGYGSPMSSSSTPITTSTAATNTATQATTAVAPANHEEEYTGEPDDSPVDFDEDLLAEDDPNEDDEAYRMRMADELAPICEGMSHEEIVDLLDDYAKQRRVRRAAYLQKKATAEKDDRTKRLLAKRRITPPPGEEEEPVTSSCSAIPTSSPTSPPQAVDQKSSLGHLMFGAVDSTVFGIPAKTIVQTQPAPQPTQKNQPPRAIPPQPLSANAPPPSIPNTAGGDEDMAQFYAPRQAEARMAQQMQELLGEFEESKRAAEEESASRSGAASRLSEAGGGRGGILKKNAGGRASTLNNKNSTAKGHPVLFEEDDDDDLLCVTSGARAIPSSFSALLNTIGKPGAVGQNHNGALSSEGQTSSAGDKEFRAKAKAMCSVRRHAPEHTGNTSPGDSPSKSSVEVSSAGRGALSTQKGGGISKAVVSAAQRASIGLSSGAAIPMPPTHALALPPAPKIQSELGKKAMAATSASMTGAPKPSVPRRSSSQTAGSTPSSNVPTPMAGGRNPTRTTESSTSNRASVTLPRKTPTPPPHALSVGGFTFLKK